MSSSVVFIKRVVFGRARIPEKNYDFHIEYTFVIIVVTKYGKGSRAEFLRISILNIISIFFEFNFNIFFIQTQIQENPQHGNVLIKA